MAKNFSEKFTRLNKTSYSFPTLKSQILAIENMNKNDIAIIVSFSATTRHIKQINKLLKEKDIKIIWITAQKEIKNSCKEIKLLVSSLKMDEFQTSIIQDHSLTSIVDILYIYYVYLYGH
ncbi:SIS domain-containing protein [uncultured Clostridium sp.]|uniref:SIS domain-containing protein n=1 Tax=uncultured Clostridium sp. TaxID=59620 RepID=UPI0026325F9A|nr:SIS domain-containing protein [uncultured Clostridium sp.]